MLADMNTLWAACNRGMDRPDLILMDVVSWKAYLASLQANQRFTDPKVGQLGFPSIKYMDADVVLDGGIGGNFTSFALFLKWCLTFWLTLFFCFALAVLNLRLMRLVSLPL